uniref:Uncharacterized protein n=1 Tax=Talaromyces marneffei PM1 TaxID=1077442 RepID=A0A093V4M5_TALMA
MEQETPQGSLTLAIPPQRVQTARTDGPGFS